MIALLVGTGLIARATHTPAVWAAPGLIGIAAMWIAGVPRRRRARTTISALLVAGSAGAVLISPAVLFALPALGLVRLVRRRGLRAARRPLTVAAAVTALAVAAGRLGLPVGIVLLALTPILLYTRRHAGPVCRVRA